MSETKKETYTLWSNVHKRRSGEGFSLIHLFPEIKKEIVNGNTLVGFTFGDKKIGFVFSKNIEVFHERIALKDKFAKAVEVKPEKNDEPKESPDGL